MKKLAKIGRNENLFIAFLPRTIVTMSAHVVTLSLTTKDLLRSSKISELFPTFLQRIFALF